MNKYNYDRDKGRPFEVTSRRRPEMGRSNVDLLCPFCGEGFRAFIWSMAGGGKKCPGCGAMHFSSGTAYPEAES